MNRNVVLIVLLGCAAGAPDTPAGAAAGHPAGQSPGPGTTTAPLYVDVTGTHLPGGVLDGLSMDARAVDVDGDGDLDILVANEFRPNILLLNDGTGRFTDGSAGLPRLEHDSEDVGTGDFDGDGDPDVIVVSEDDRTNELYFNRGDGTFTDEGARLPVEGTSNAVLVADVTGDGVPDILVGNAGQNVLLVGDGKGGFVDETDARLPAFDDVTQDLELGDVDGDRDLDLLVANEGANRILLNDGSGRFEEAPAGSIPLREAPEETREGDFGDVDGDGDLDILFANVSAFVAGADPRNRLLLNDGGGRFTGVTRARLPADPWSSFDGDFFDLDGDGDLDILTSNSDTDLAQRRIADAPYLAYLNDGTGVFRQAEEGEILPAGTAGTGFDAIFHDLDGDGRPDLFLAGRGSPDRLLLRR